MNRIIAKGLGVLAAIAMVATVVPQQLHAQYEHPGDVNFPGSLGFGIDIPLNPNYGFDTMRMQENNLRIHFDDTSNSASFPNNDWRIIINDSSNGGGNYFAIEDSTAGRVPFKLDAGAPTDSLRVDAQGDLGLGTATPVVELHIKDGDSPTLRLEQDGSSGFTPQTWDLAGNETNFFIRDVTNGSKLPFRIRPDAPDSSIDIQASGDVVFSGDSNGDTRLLIDSGSANDDYAEVVFREGIDRWAFGHAAMDDRFYIFEYGGNNIEALSIASGTGDATFRAKTNGDTRVFIDSGSAANDFAELVFQENASDRWSFGHASGNDRFYIFDYAGSAGEALTILQNGNVGVGQNAPTFDFQVGMSGVNSGSTTFTISSSRTMKENINPVKRNGILEKISDVGVYTYDYVDGPKDKLGLIAEDFHKVFERGSDKQINGQEVQMALWLAVQELEERTIAQENRIKELESQLQALSTASEQE